MTTEVSDCHKSGNQPRPNLKFEVLVIRPCFHNGHYTDSP